MNIRQFDDAHPRKRILSNFSNSSDDARILLPSRLSPTFKNSSTHSTESGQSKPKKIKLSENLLPNLLEKMNVDTQDDQQNFTGPSGFSPNGRKSPDGILTKAQFKSAFQCKGLQKIQEDDNEEYFDRNYYDSNDESDDESEDCIFAEEPSSLNSGQPILKFNINLPTIIPFPKKNSLNSEKFTNSVFQNAKSDSKSKSSSPNSTFNKNLQIMPYQPSATNRSADFLLKMEDNQPEERNVERSSMKSPGTRQRISGTTDSDFIASLEMDL